MTDLNVVTPGNEDLIDDPHYHDVLCGRGGSINSHPGNERFRELVEKRKRVYLTARFKREKRLIASSIVSEIRGLEPSGRFLTKDAKSGKWKDIGDEKARDKTSQALRENAPKVRAEIETEINKQRAEMKQNEAMEDATIAETTAIPPSPYYHAWAGGHYRPIYGYGLPPGAPPPEYPPPGPYQPYDGGLYGYTSSPHKNSSQLLLLMDPIILTTLIRVCRLTSPTINIHNLLLKIKHSIVITTEMRISNQNLKKSKPLTPFQALSPRFLPLSQRGPRIALALVNRWMLVTTINPLKRKRASRLHMSIVLSLIDGPQESHSATTTMGLTRDLAITIVLDDLARASSAMDTARTAPRGPRRSAVRNHPSQRPAKRPYVQETHTDDDENNSLLSQVASHIMGSWETPIPCANGSSDDLAITNATLPRRRSRSRAGGNDVV